MTIANYSQKLYREPTRRARFDVYICICNALTDRDIHRAATAAGARRPLEVFAACRCRVQCGTCVRKLRDLMLQAIATAELAEKAPTVAQ